MDHSDLLKALELDKNGDWDAAHRIVQSYNSSDACWIHAYLHRKEGDLGNAGYWYNRAEKSMPSISLDAEWEIIFQEMNNR
jgi:hypothetical protein